MGKMDDEVMERLEGEGESQEVPRGPSPHDYDAKPLWARALVISAGVIMNMIFAFFVYTAVIGIWGVPELSSTRIGQVREATLPAGTEALATLPAGASVVRVGDRAVQTWTDVTQALAEAPAGPTEVVTRAPDRTVRIDLPGPSDARSALVGSVRAWLDAGVGGVEPGSPADRAGLEAGDEILSVDGEPVGSWDVFVERIQSRPGRTVELTIERNGERLARAVTPDATTETDAATGETRTIGKVGIYPAVGDLTYSRVSPVRAVTLGAEKTAATTGLIVGFLRRLLGGDVPARSVGSIVTIGQASGQAAEAGIQMFLEFIALFSINLAVLNLLPIPVLDGGHLLFLAIEGLRGRALSVEQRLRWSNVGFLILMGIMLFALSNDVRNLLGF